MIKNNLNWSNKYVTTQGNHKGLPLQQYSYVGAILSLSPLVKIENQSPLFKSPKRPLNVTDGVANPVQQTPLVKIENQS